MNRSSRLIGNPVLVNHNAAVEPQKRVCGSLSPCSNNNDCVQKQSQYTFRMYVCDTQL